MPKFWGKQIFTQFSSGSKAKEGEKERLNDDNNNGQLRIANATSGVAHKPPGAKKNWDTCPSLPDSLIACLQYKKSSED